MSIISKRTAASICSFIAGASIIGAVGAADCKPIPMNADLLLPQAEETSAPMQSSEKAEQLFIPSVKAGAAEVKAVRTYTAVKIKLPQPKDQAAKAGIDDYTMLMQIDVPQEEKADEPAEVISVKTAEKKTKKTAAPDEEYDSDHTTIYDDKPDKIKKLKTRSVADEYYSVFDERSGSYRYENCHEMLCQMVNNEVGSEWGDEAIKAQIVAAYTHLRYCDEHGIVPTIGMRADYDEHIEELVSEVEGQAVFYDGEIINAVYSASTAGYTVESERIWGTAQPYLQCVVSEYDKDDPYYGLETVFSKAEVKAILESTCGIVLSDDQKNWFLMEDIYSKRYVGYITIDGQTQITCRTLQDTFGLQSQAVRVSFKGDNVIFRTFGWGHGVGMSQWGARGYSEHGWSYDQILRHYYVKTEIKLTEDTAGEQEDNGGGQLPEYLQEVENYGIY